MLSIEADESTMAVWLQLVKMCSGLLAINRIGTSEKSLSLSF